MAPGDVIGWYESGVGIIAYNEANMTMVPRATVIANGQAKPAVGAIDLDTRDLVFDRTYGIQICHGEIVYTSIY